MTGPEYTWRVHAYSTTGVAHAWIAHPYKKGSAARSICGTYGYASGKQLSAPDVDELPRCNRCLAAIKRIEASS